MVGCLDVPTRGKVFLKGKDISLMSEDQLSQMRGRTIGFIFQEFNLLSNIDALENVMMPMIFQGAPLLARERRAMELLEGVGLKERMLHQPAELSGGERQKVAIARAFANDPELVIADEPTGNLDSKTGKMIMETLSQFHQKEGKTIIVVSHDPVIAAYSKYIINIRDGEIVKNHNHSSETLWTSQ
jgi:putative ABC transport system ATP-binding protein